MKTLNYATDFISDYSNNGQAKEQQFRFVLTGERCKADNLSASKGCDIFNMSLKSARATVCKGRDLLAHLATDAATEFVYLAKNDIAYIMSRQEWIEFVGEFGTLTRESAKNGGHEKIRLGHESQKMLEWLNERANE